MKEKEKLNQLRPYQRESTKFPLAEAPRGAPRLQITPKKPSSPPFGLVILIAATILAIVTRAVLLPEPIPIAPVSTPATIILIRKGPTLKHTQPQTSQACPRT